MDDFIIKPFDAATLISSVMHHTVGARVPVAQCLVKLEPPKVILVWPEIVGIDTQDARSRWCDDLALFRSMLGSWLDEFAIIAVPSSRTSPAELRAQAICLHKLRGGACMLGAKLIQHLAAEAEAACVDGDAIRAAEHSMELVTRLDALRSSAARAFESAEPTTSPSGISLEPQVVVERERIDAPIRNPRRGDPEGRCSVLLVDDDDIARASVANLLERSGHRVGQAASGEEALRALRGSGYGIVITDWQMPGMSGLDLCRRLRTDTESRHLYLMVMSASNGPEDASLSRSAGADAYVLKSAPTGEISARMAAARSIAQLRSLSHDTARVSVP